LNPVFKSAAYRRLWLNTAFNGVSASADHVLIGWLALEVTGTSSWVGRAFALYYLPMLVLGVLAGSLADHFSRRRLIQALELVAAAVIALFATVFAYTTVSIGHVLLLTLALGSLRAVHGPVRLAYAYDLSGARQATPALAGINVASRVGWLIGAVLVGTLAERFGISPALLAMALMHLVAAPCLAGMMAQAHTNRQERTSIVHNLRDYLAELKVNRVLLVLVLVTPCIEVFGTSYSTVLPELTRSRLGLGAQGLGWMHGAQAVGGLIVGLVLFILPQRKRNAGIYAACVLTLGAGLLMLADASVLPAVLLILALISAMISAWDILTQSMMQRCVPDRLRGRAMGGWMLAIGSSPLGHLEVGFLTAAMGVEIALQANGIGVITVIILAFLATPALRRL
jgi:MFS family permease|tara:strand:+ start:7206 stop:8399 length:1194 start_codon:yes stop_codon:yes gene_type:complete